MALEILVDMGNADTSTVALPELEGRLSLVKANDVTVDLAEPQLSPWLGSCSSVTPWGHRPLLR